jgi:trimeric autotransporter adhesin
MTDRAHRRRCLQFLAAFLCAIAAWPALAPAAQVLNNPAPTVNSFSPTSAVAGSPSITLDIFGNNFLESATVSFGGQPLMPQALTLSHITVVVPSSALTQAGTRYIYVSNPPPGGGTTMALMQFQVVPPPKHGG